MDGSTFLRGNKMHENATIYLIDDDPAVVRLMTRILTDAGYRVVSFSSGEDFLAEENLSDDGCVITDLCLPGIQGTELQSHLQRVKSPLAQIVISGKADVPTAVRLMKSGAVTLLQKPFSPDELLSAVVEGLALNARQLAQSRQSQEVQKQLQSLTEDEYSVFCCLVHGMSRKSIIARLPFSPRTLDRRQQSLLQKMQVNTVAELITHRAAKSLPTIPVGGE